MNRAVFFDRDGVLNKLIYRDSNYYSPRDIKNFVLYKDAAKVTEAVRNKGYLSIIISNQPDISRGNIDKALLNKFTQTLLDELIIDDIFYCTHDDNNLCSCRKPAPGLLIEASEKWNIDLEKSYMVGDTWKDAEAAKYANVDFILLNSDYNLDYDTHKRVNSIKDIFIFIEG